MKLGEMCGTTVVNLRCQLPTEDLDALISITSDEDLGNLIEEYDRAAAGITSSSTTHHKIRAFLSNPNKKLSPSSSIASNISQTTSSSPVSTPVSTTPTLTVKNSSSGCRWPKVVLPPTTNRCIHQMSNRKLPVMKLIPPQPFYNNNSYGKGVAAAGSRFPPQYAYYTTKVHNGNHWP